MDERLKKQLDFSLEIDKEKNILRQTHLSGNGRNENDAGGQETEYIQGIETVIETGIETGHKNRA